MVMPNRMAVATIERNERRANAWAASRMTLARVNLGWFGAAFGIFGIWSWVPAAEIQIPTTPARFRESVAHELAHHVEHACGQFGDLRSALHPQLGRPGSPWAGGRVWEEVPSERWAEAVVELVNGERIRHVDEVTVDDDVIAAIAAWARGEPAPPPD